MTEPHADPATPRPREKRVRVILDRALSASAGLVALCALTVSIYQAWTAREQQKMSAWPYVTQSNTGGDGYSRIVQNVGLGPALVRSMRVEVDGRPVTQWGQFLMAALRTDSATLVAQTGPAGFWTSSVRPGMVLLPGSDTRLAHAADGPFATALRAAFNDETRVHITICYCSLYKDCWTSDNRALEPSEVRACPAADPALEFRS